MRSSWMAGAVIAIAIRSATAVAGAAEIRLAEQFSMGYLQFNVMKRDKLIEKYATQRGLGISRSPGNASTARWR